MTPTSGNSSKSPCESFPFVKSLFFYPDPVLFILWSYSKVEHTQQPLQAPVWLAFLIFTYVPFILTQSLIIFASTVSAKADYMILFELNKHWDESKFLYMSDVKFMSDELIIGTFLSLPLLLGAFSILMELFESRLIILAEIFTRFDYSKLDISFFRCLSRISIKSVPSNALGLHYIKNS